MNSYDIIRNIILYAYEKYKCVNTMSGYLNQDDFQGLKAFMHWSLQEYDLIQRKKVSKLIYYTYIIQRNIYDIFTIHGFELWFGWVHESLGIFDCFTWSSFKYHMIPWIKVFSLSNTTSKLSDHPSRNSFQDTEVQLNGSSSTLFLFE